MTGDLTTSGDIQSRDLIATRELHADGFAFLNSTLTVGGVLTANNTVNIQNAIKIPGGRGTNNTGAYLKVIGTGDLVYNTSALSFGGSSTESHVFELSWLGMAHFMRLTAGSTTWSQTMLIEPSTGRWKFYLGLNVIGTVYGTAFSSTSDSRLKTNIEEIPEQDAINLLKNVSAKTYNRIDTKNTSKRHCGFIAQDFINIPKSLGENFVEPLLTKKR